MLMNEDICVMDGVVVVMSVKSSNCVEPIDEFIGEESRGGRWAEDLKWL